MPTEDHLYEPVPEGKVLAHRFLGLPIPALPMWVQQTVEQQTDSSLHVKTVNGTERCSLGDWIVRSLEGYTTVLSDGLFRSRHVVPEDESSSRDLVPVEGGSMAVTPAEGPNLLAGAPAPVPTSTASQPDGHVG